MNTPETNLYEVLGVPRTATGDEIKKAYRKLSLQCHPDRNNNAESAKEEFQNVSRAYTVLGDETTRRQYDLLNSGGNNGFFSFMNGGGMGDMPTMFATELNLDPAELLKFFSGFHPQGQGHGHQGQGQGQWRPQHNPNGFFNIDSLKANLMKPLPIVKTEEISLSKAYTGCTIPIEVQRWIIEGDVRREETETVYLTIPLGVDNNEIIIVREKGNVLRDSIKGDVKVFIKVVNDTEFVRNGLDLFLHKRISLKEALCGFSFDMKHVDGRTFKINNGSGNIVCNNYNKVLHGMGMKRNEHTGTLTINFTVAFPEQLSADQIEHLKNVLV